MSVRSPSADDPDKAIAREAVDLAKRAEGDNDLALWAATLLKSREAWQQKRRKREQILID